MDEDVEVGPGVRLDHPAGRQSDDVGVQISATGLQLPHGPVHIGLVDVRGDVDGIDQDPGSGVLVRLVIRTRQFRGSRVRYSQPKLPG